MANVADKEVTALAGKANIREGIFLFRETYTMVKPRRDNDGFSCDYKNTYTCDPDRLRLNTEIKDKSAGDQEITQSCEIVCKNLCRDNCETFKDPLRVAFLGGPDNPIQKNTSISWWQLSKEDNLEGQLRHEYIRILKEMGLQKDGQPVEIEPIIGNTPLAQSDPFTDEFSRGYTERCKRSYTSEIPNARYHCGLNELIRSYKDLLKCDEVEFRKHGTTFYKMETMHSVLICPVGKLDEMDDRFPLIPVQPFSERGQHKVVKGQKIHHKHYESREVDVVSLERDVNNDYRIIWRPVCTIDCDSSPWDKLAFGFFLPSNDIRLPLPLPYKMQKKENPEDMNHRTFGKVISVKDANGKYTTDMCGKEFSRKCSRYPAAMTTKHRRARHIENVRGQVRQICSDCGSSFKSTSALKAHKKLHEETPVVHKCTTCGKTLKHRRYLREHEKLHGEPSHQCSHCGKTFHQRGALRKHTQRKH